MNADLALTAYDKRSEYLSRVIVLPDNVRAYARGVAGVPVTDPSILGVYPLSEQQAEAIARKALLSLDLGDCDYCLETIAKEEHPRAHRAQPR